MGGQHSSLAHGAGRRAGLVHAVLLARGAEDYLDGVARFVRHGVVLGEPVLVAVPGHRLGQLRAVLGPTASDTRFVDMAQVGRNPARIIPAVLCAFADEHPHGRVRVVAEPVWADRSAAEYPGCVQHEALINLALAERPVTVLCAYDTGQLAPSTRVDAASTHPILLEQAEWRASPSFTDPADVVDAWNQPLPEPPDVPTTVVFTAPDGPRQVRRVTHEVAARAGLTGGRLTDLLLAVNEIATNTVLHTGRPGLFSIWSEPGEVVCQVYDSGHIRDLLAGRRCPAPHDTAGHGLRLVHDLCDLVRIHSRPGETTVRLHMRLAPDHEPAQKPADGTFDADTEVSAPPPPPASPPRHRRAGRHRAASCTVGPHEQQTSTTELPSALAPPKQTPPRTRARSGFAVAAAVRQQAAYAEEATSYDARTAVLHHWRRRAVERLPLRPGDVVLDIGCGTGACFPLLQQPIGPSGTIIGIDASTALLELARQRVAARAWNNVILIEAAAENAAIPRKADHALFCAVHDILQSPQALRTVLAQVRPGGSVTAVGAKWAPPWAIGPNALVAATHTPLVRDFTGFDRPWALLADQLPDLQVREIDLGCGYLASGRTPAH